MKARTKSKAGYTDLYALTTVTGNCLYVRKQDETNDVS